MNPIPVNMCDASLRQNLTGLSDDQYKCLCDKCNQSYTAALGAMTQIGLSPSSSNPLYNMNRVARDPNITKFGQCAADCIGVDAIYDAGICAQKCIADNSDPSCISPNTTTLPPSCVQQMITCSNKCIKGSPCPSCPQCPSCPAESLQSPNIMNTKVPILWVLGLLLLVMIIGYIAGSSTTDNQ